MGSERKSSDCCNKLLGNGLSLGFFLFFLSLLYSLVPLLLLLVFQLSLDLIHSFPGLGVLHVLQVCLFQFIFLLSLSSRGLLVIEQIQASLGNGGGNASRQVDCPHVFA